MNRAKESERDIYVRIVARAQCGTAASVAGRKPSAGRNRLVALSVAASAAISIPLLCRSAQASNIAQTFTTTSGGALDSPSNWSGGVEPSATTDALIDNTVTSSYAFTFNSSAETFGSFSDTNTSAPITISAADNLTLGGAGDSPQSSGGVPGASAGDLLYVASGASLTYSTSGSAKIALAQSGNFDIAGNATINLGFTGGSGVTITQTGGGTLTLTGNSSGFNPGAWNINSGTLEITNIIAAVNVGPMTLNGGTLEYNDSTASNNNGVVINVGASGGTLNIANADLPENANNELIGSGALTLTGGNGTLPQTTGVGALYMSHTSTYSGNLTVQSGGIFEWDNTGATASTAQFTIGSNGGLAVDPLASAFSLPVTVANGSSGGTLYFNNGTSTIASTISLGSSSTLTMGMKDWYKSTAQSGTVSGLITGPGGILVSGGGTLTLSNTNNYSGGTQVAAGELIDGTASGQGEGTGNVTVAPTGSTATFEMMENTDLSSTQSLLVTTGGDVYLNFSGGPGNADIIGGLSYNGASLAPGYYYATGSGDSGGTTESYLSGTGELEIVPEPASAGLLTIGALGLLTRRRRRIV